MADFKISELPTTTEATTGDFIIINKNNEITNRIDALNLVNEVAEGNYLSLADVGDQLVSSTGNTRYMGGVEIRKRRDGNGTTLTLMASQNSSGTNVGIDFYGAGRTDPGESFAHIEGQFTSNGGGVGNRQTGNLNVSSSNSINVDTGGALNLDVTGDIIGDGSNITLTSSSLFTLASADKIRLEAADSVISTSIINAKRNNPTDNLAGIQVNTTVGAQNTTVPSNADLRGFTSSIQLNKEISNFTHYDTSNSGLSSYVSQNVYGFRASFSGAKPSNNNNSPSRAYGFYSSVGSKTQDDQETFNFYADSNAANHFGGVTTLGSDRSNPNITLEANTGRGNFVGGVSVVGGAVENVGRGVYAGGIGGGIGICGSRLDEPHNPNENGRTPSSLLRFNINGTGVFENARSSGCVLVNARSLQSTDEKDNEFNLFKIDCVNTNFTLFDNDNPGQESSEVQQINGFVGFTNLQKDAKVVQFTTSNVGMSSHCKGFKGFNSGFNGMKPYTVNGTPDPNRPIFAAAYYATGQLQANNSAEKECIDAFNFYAASGLNNFFYGNTYIGGIAARDTFTLWERNLTEEQSIAYKEGTLVPPNNVITPGDGSFVRQWWYDQQTPETQALIDGGQLNYPTRLQPANFTNTFAVGVDTEIDLLSNGVGYFSNKVGIGTKNSLDPLNVVAGSALLRVQNSNGFMTLKVVNTANTTMEDLRVVARDFHIYNSNSSRTAVFKQNGNVGIGIASPNESLEVEGNIRATGTIEPKGLIIRLDSDNSDNYTAEGVYNGPTLDVKDRLQKTQTALESLRTEAAAANDLDSLKSAIATALANI